MIELIHPELSNVSKADIKAKLAVTLKSKDENISIFGLKTKFGGGRSTGFALIYDSLDARKKFDSKKMLRRVSHMTMLPVLEVKFNSDSKRSQKSFYLKRIPL